MANSIWGSGRRAHGMGCNRGGPTEDSRCRVGQARIEKSRVRRRLASLCEGEEGHNTCATSRNRGSQEERKLLGASSPPATRPTRLRWLVPGLGYRAVAYLCVVFLGVNPWRTPALENAFGGLKLWSRSDAAMHFRLRGPAPWCGSSPYRLSIMTGGHPSSSRSGVLGLDQRQRRGIPRGCRSGPQTRNPRRASRLAAVHCVPAVMPGHGLTGAVECGKGPPSHATHLRRLA
jgi:hypothetical protein